MTPRPANHTRRVWLNMVIAAMVALTFFGALPARAQNDNDHTLEAMQDEMARNVARLIPDGATIQTGIGGIPEATLALLKSSARWRKSATGLADFCSWYRSTRSFARLRKAAS